MWVLNIKKALCSLKSHDSLKHKNAIHEAGSSFLWVKSDKCRTSEKMLRRKYKSDFAAKFKAKEKDKERQLWRKSLEY